MWASSSAYARASIATSTSNRALSPRSAGSGSTGSRAQAEPAPACGRAPPAYVLGRATALILDHRSRRSRSRTGGDGGGHRPLIPVLAAAGDGRNDDRRDCGDCHQGEDRIERPPGPPLPGRQAPRASPAYEVCRASGRTLPHFLDRLVLSRRGPSTVLGLPPPSWGPATVPAIVGIHPPVDPSLVHRPTPRLPATRAGQVSGAARSGRNMTLPLRQLHLCLLRPSGSHQRIGATGRGTASPCRSAATDPDATYAHRLGPR